MVADAGVELVLTTTAVSAKADASSRPACLSSCCRWLDVDDVRTSAPAPVVADAASVGRHRVPAVHVGIDVGAARRDGDARQPAAQPRRQRAPRRARRRVVSVSWLPVNHDMGLIQGVLAARVQRLPGLADVAGRVSAAAGALAPGDLALRATHSGGPNFAYDLCVRRVVGSSIERRSTSRPGEWPSAARSRSGSPLSTRSTGRSSSRGFRRAAFRPCVRPGRVDAARHEHGVEPGTENSDTRSRGASRRSRGARDRRLGSGRGHRGLRLGRSHDPHRDRRSGNSASLRGQRSRRDLDRGPERRPRLLASS